MAIRIKPLGAGNSDNLAQNIDEKFTKKKIQKIDANKNTIVMGDDRKVNEYKFPSKVLDDKSDQEQVYD